MLGRWSTAQGLAGVGLYRPKTEETERGTGGGGAGRGGGGREESHGLFDGVAPGQGLSQILLVSRVLGPNQNFQLKIPNSRSQRVFRNLA